jgi:Holliday junction resolvasome RuvABC endonuclease subunit
MRILAIDPAKLCGYAWSDGQRLEYGVWDITGGIGEHDGASLARLIEFIADTAKSWGIDRIAYEDAGFGSRNPSVQATHNEKRGVIKYAAHRLGVPCVGFHPSEIKALTGNGRAKKWQMIRYAKLQLGIETDSDNVADALFILKLAERGRSPSVAKKKKAAAKRRVKEPRLF